MIENVVKDWKTLSIPIVVHVLPYVLSWIELRAFGRQRDYGDVDRHDEFVREVPSGLVDKQRRVSSRAIAFEISAKWRFMAMVLQYGSTRAAPLPSSGKSRRKCRSMPCVGRERRQAAFRASPPCFEGVAARIEFANR